MGMVEQRVGSCSQKRLKAAAKIASNSGLRAGLVLREESRFYVAECIDLVFDGKGKRIGSPDPDLTPSCYRTDACGAWLKLSNIREVSRPEYNLKFGKYPVGDSTLYEVKGDNGELTLTPSPSWNFKPHDCQSTEVLHISDLHFGEMHGFTAGARPAGMGKAQRSLAEMIADQLDSEDCQPSVVVVSGDLVSRGNAEGFSLAAEFLEDLEDRLSIDRSSFVIVPGNHDFHEITSDMQPLLDYRHERDYRMFIRGYYGRDTQDLESLHRFLMPSGWEVSAS